MSIKIIKELISKNDLREIAKDQFGDMVKAVVDIKQGIMAIGGELHADEEAVMIENGSRQHNLWGINLYPDILGEDWIEFNSMINIRPSQGNKTRGIEDQKIQHKIREIVAKLIPN
ncbi:MAG: DUF5674 family protein [bacterium]|nr:DUF5674 family protein [bacterium]